MNKQFEKHRVSWLNFEEFQNQFQKVEVKEYSNNVLTAVSNPVLSVLLITYQHASFIRMALDSVLKQNFDEPWELIIGDDESSDGTREICIEYAKKHPDLIRLFLHKRENNIHILDKPCGIFQIVYNTLKTRGKYISILSGDDYWTSEHKLTKQYKFLESKPKFSMVYMPVQYKKIHDNGEVEFSEIRKRFAFPCTVMGRNLFDKLPKEMLKSLNEDTFFNSIYAQYGSRGFISNAGHAVMHHNGKNLWAEGNKEIKSKHYLNTTYLLYKVFGKFNHSHKRGFANCIAKNGSNNEEFIKKSFKNDKWLYFYYLCYKFKSKFTF